MDEITSPILLITFNRPRETLKVIHALARVKPRKVYFVSDGARSGRKGEMELVEECRNLVTNIDWPCEVLTKFSETNLGCKRSVVEALDWVFGHEEEVIILEDDCVPTSDFFSFCQEMLNVYRNDSRVGSVSGSNLEITPSSAKGLSYWFSNFPEVWGWATWRRAWEKYEVDLAKFSKSSRIETMSSILSTTKARRYWQSRLNSVASGKVDTWDYQLTFMHWRHRLLSIIPSANLVLNIGFGPNATHTISKPSADLQLDPGELTWPLKRPSVVEPSKDYDEQIVRKRFNVGSLRLSMEFTYSLLPINVQSLVRKCISSASPFRRTKEVALKREG
jgi:hypothetical protein